RADAAVTADPGTYRGHHRIPSGRRPRRIRSRLRGTGVRHHETRRPRHAGNLRNRGSAHHQRRASPALVRGTGLSITRAHGRSGRLRSTGRRRVVGTAGRATPDIQPRHEKRRRPPPVLPRRVTTTATDETAGFDPAGTFRTRCGHTMLALKAAHETP